MDLKKNKKKSSSSASFDRLKFCYSDAANVHSELMTRNLVREWGIDMASPNTDVAFKTRMRGWQDFTRSPHKAVVSLVHEFYTNLKVKDENLIVLVRGKVVPFDCRTINELYKLQNFDKDDYTTYLEERLNYDDIIDMLCFPGTHWKRNEKDVISFPKSDMKEEEKCWMNFVTAKLMPSSHTSDVTKDRATLVFTIVTHMTVDVRKIIQTSILNTARGTSTIGLPHPSLITVLCEKARVQWNNDEELAKPQAPIKACGTKKTSQRTVQDNSEAGPSSNNQGPTCSRLPSIASLADLNERVTSIEKEMRQRWRRDDVFQQQVDTFMQYSIDIH